MVIERRSWLMSCLGEFIRSGERVWVWVGS